MLGNPIDPSEKKALLIALIPCLLFIAYLTVFHPPSSRIRVESRIPNYRPAPPPEQFHVEEPVVKEWHQPSSVVPKNFVQVDFENRSYGPYHFADGSIVNLTLTGGNYLASTKQNYGWFSLKHVYYTDLTGDGSDDAIVVLSHAMCDGCDGGSHLLYIYTARNGNLKPLWQYETGALLKGCGLKGLTMNGKQFLIELFGRCPQQGKTEDSGQLHGTVYESTFVLYAFNGKTFVQKSLELVQLGSVDVMGHEPEIRIYDSPADPAELKSKMVSQIFSFVSIART